jgi:hypothetical protein
MMTTATVVAQLLELAGDGWTAEPSAGGVIRPVDWLDRRFVPNITVLGVEEPPALDVPSTAVQLAGSLDETAPVELHQVVVDDFDGLSVTHETVWLTSGAGSHLVVTSSACGADIAPVARLMRRWRTDLRGGSDR